MQLKFLKFTLKLFDFHIETLTQQGTNLQVIKHEIPSYTYIQN